MILYNLGIKQNLFALCCGFSSNNPYVGEEAAHFFGKRAGVWYYVVVKFE